MYVETSYILAAVALITVIFALNILVPTRMVRKSRKRAMAYTLSGVVGFFLVMVLDIVVFEIMDLL